MVEGEARLVKTILGYIVSTVFPTSQKNKGKGPENDLCNLCPVVRLVSLLARSLQENDIA